MKKTARLTLVLFMLLAAQLVHAQRVALYIGDYSAGVASNVQWAKATHLIYAFLNPMSTTGAVNTSTTVWYNNANFTATVNAARTANPSIKVIISVGGAPGSDDITTRLNTIFASATARAQMQTDLINFIQANNLDGMDLDLEHPVSAAEKNNHETFLSEMKTRLNTLEATMCKELELSIALNGETNHFLVTPTGSDYVNATAINYVDIVNLMTYDMATAAHGNPNHSPLSFAQEAVQAFSSAPYNWPKSKMMIGIPFYGRTSGGSASNYINFGGTAAAYTSDYTGGYYYNGCPTIQSKVNYAHSDGLAGVLVWEAGGDIQTGAYSLLSCIYSATVSAYGSLWKGPERPCCRKPKLGNDVATCLTPFSVTLNSGTPTATNVTFTWKRIAPSALTLTTSSSSANTQSVTAANGVGTYVVIRDSIVGGFTCSRTDTIVINAALPTPSLGPDITMCATSYTLTPSNLSAFPAGTTFQWQYNGADITGATSSTFYGSTPGTYTLIASATGCTPTSDDIVVSAPAASPIDACRTSAGTLTLQVTGGTGPFTWYNAEIPFGSIVGTGTSYTTPTLSMPSTTYYYVEDAGAATTSALGIVAAAPTGWANFITNPASYSGSIAMEFSVANNVKISSVDVFPYSASTYPLAFRIEIFNSSNTIVYTSSTYSYATYPGAAAQTLAMDANLAPGFYRMRAVVVSGGSGAGAPALAHHLTSTYPYTIPSGSISITSTKNVGQYGPFYNWQIKEFGTCKRIKVKATVAASCVVVLPVTLLNFSADRSSSAVVLNWATASELNNDHFAVQRSLDGENFETIGMVGGRGNSSIVNHYTYTDFNAPTSKTYYRLVQVDIDGASSHSSVVSVEDINSSEVYVQPNPFTDKTNVVVKGITGAFTLNVYAVDGSLVYQKDYASSSETISLGESLTSGFYILEIVSSSSTLKYKFIKE